MVLDATNTLKPSSSRGEADTVIGIPTMMICLQLVTSAFFFYHA